MSVVNPRGWPMHEEREQLRDTVRRLLAKRAPSAEVRRAAAQPEGFDRALWRELAELGLTGLLIDEAYGGSGGSLADVAVVCGELGRALLPGPYLASAVLAAGAITAAADEETKRELLPGIAAGTTIATVAKLEAGAEKTRDGWRLTGIAPLVLDGHVADLALVTAVTADGPMLFRVAERGWRRTPLVGLDPTRKLARWEFSSTPAELLGAAGADDYTLIALAAEQVGGAARCLEMAVEHVRTRHQFGRPIGAFQAVKHRCADMLLRVETARSAVEAAAADPTPVNAALAAAYCSEAYTFVAGESIQLHGGIGVTAEHDAQLHLKRATSGSLLFGAPRHHRARLATAVGI